MRRIWGGILALMVCIPAVRADDKGKSDRPADAPKSPAQQIADLEKEFEKEFEIILKEFRTATGEDRDKVRDKAFKLAPDYAKKIMAVVEANPKDPAIVKGLIWIAGVSPRNRIPPPPQAGEAIDLIVRNHIASPDIGELCGVLELRSDGEKVLRQIREKNSSKSVRALAALSLATVLSSEDERKPPPKQLEEADKLLAMGIDEAKALKEFPIEKLREAEGNLFEMRNLSVGKIAPELESTDLDGRKVKLSDYKGKVVVLDFWATFCGPCKAMIPQERELVKKHQGKPFAFISVSGDAEKDSLTDFLKHTPMPWTHWWAGARGILEKWNVRYFPTIYVIDAKGTIRYKQVNNKELDAAIDTLLKELETTKK